MSNTDWIALVAAALTVALNIGGFLVGWGVMKGTIRALEARIQTLEREIQAVGDLKVSVARVESSVGFIAEQMREMNTSIRWMRDPASHTA